MTAPDDQNQLFRILGQVGAPQFAPWIARHARKLGLKGRIVAQQSDRIDLALSGPPELLDAMALACSLGPREVWVDQIERESRNAHEMDNFTSDAG